VSRTGTILGVDFGLKRIGTSFGGEETGVAFAGPVLTGGEEELLRGVVREAASHEASTIVVGLPRNMDGTESKMSARARAFGDKLHAATQAEIVMWDERLTSREADRAMLQGDLSRKKRKKRIDSMAAQLMLQSYLDSRPRE